MRYPPFSTLRALSACVLAVAACVPDGSPPSAIEHAAGDASTPTTPYGTTLYHMSVDGPLRSVFVHYTPEAPSDRLSRVFGAEARSATDYGHRIPRMGLEVEASSLQAVVARLEALPWVSKVEIGRDESRIASVPNQPAGKSSIADRMAIDTVPWGISFARGTDAQSVAAVSGDGVKVAILDTGMNCSHPDLSGRIVGGYDYVSMSSGAACTESVHHGTAVAGILAAAVTNSYLIGMAPEADLYSVRVCGSVFCTDAAMVNGIGWARDNNMDLINFSIADCGGDSTETVAFMIRQAVSDGIVFVASAGNGTAVGCSSGAPVSSHARQTGVIAVSAILPDTTTPSGYQYSSHVDLSAPSNTSSDSSSNKTAIFCCTSAAVPHVAGAAALLLEAGVSPSSVPQRLFDNAIDHGAAGKDNYFGYGAVNALKAAVPGPQISGWTYCTSGVIYPGSCLVRPTRTNGVPGFQWRWQITYSNGALSPIDTGWITDSTYTVSVPTGEYEIEVKATVRETTNIGFSRVSTTSTHYLQVCPAEENFGLRGEETRRGRHVLRVFGTPPTRNGAAGLFAICPED